MFTPVASDPTIAVSLLFFALTEHIYPYKTMPISGHAGI